MKSTTIRIVSCILVLAVCFSLVACSHTETPGSSTDTGSTNLKENTNITGTASTKTEHYVEGTLHKVNVTPTDRVFFSDSKTEYKIVYGTGKYDADAASLIATHLTAVAKGTIEKIQYTADMTYSADSKIIALNCPELFTQAGLTMPADDLGPSGYYIKSTDQSVFIAFRQDVAAKLAAVRFLKYCIGFEMYSEDTVTYTNSAETLPDFDVIERPDYDFGSLGNYASQAAIDGMGMNTTGDIFIPIEGYQWHNSLYCLPKDVYQAEHEKWYSTSGQELCYAARGDAEELEQMTTEVANIMYNIANKPQYLHGRVICFSIMDHFDVCGCEACAESRNTYNGADSAVVIKFMNMVNRKLQAKLQADADANGTEKRELGLLLLAYHKTEAAPAVKVDGKYQPIDDSVKCDPEVGVMIAPIDADYTKSFYEDANETYANTIDGWASICDSIFVWLYETSFGHYLFPFNTFDSMGETFRFCKLRGATFILPEGQWNQENSTAFGKMKDYFNSRMRFNVNDSFADISNDFFENYFMDAAEPMRQYFNELQAHLVYNDSVYTELTGNIYNTLDVTKYWPYATLTHWMDLIDQAYEAIAKYEETSPDLYDTLRRHIMLESIFPRYALCNLHGGMYTSEELLQMRKDFRTDCITVNVTLYNEGKSLEEIYSAWGI